jgi:ribonuclease Z
MQATFESSKKAGSTEYEFEHEALAKRHSMTHEAVQTGKTAGAYRTILTHFSQRYPKIPVVDDSFQDSTCIAFDLMSVNLKGEI